MDILVVTWNFPPRRGGIEYLISNLCAGLKKNHSIFVITTYAPSANISEAKVFRAPFPGLAPFVFYALWRGAWLLAKVPEIKVILGGSAMVTPLVLLLARLFRRKAVILGHGLDLVYRSVPYQFFCVRWIKFCDRIIANSRYTASLAERRGARPKRITVIPPGVHCERFSSPGNAETTKRKLGLEEKRIVLFVGRLAKRKGAKEFIQNSFAKIVQEVPNACLVIVGDNPKDSLTQRDDVLSEIKAVISNKALQNHIRLLGALDDVEVSKLYEACDVVILPALPSEDDVEGFGIVLLEAAAAGKPAVATRVGGIPDAVEDGMSGIIVEAEHYEGMTRTIAGLLRDDQSRLAMGDYARRRVREKFPWEEVTKRYEQLFVSLTNTVVT